MTEPAFVTCDLLDDHPDLQVCSPSIDGKQFKNFGGTESFYGPVETVKCFEDNSRVKELLATPGNGRVLVVDGGASMRCALLGDLIAASAVENGWAGVVIYGCVRDVDALKKMPLGVQALAGIPRKSNRKGAGETSVPLSFGGLQITPGHHLYADNNGILVSDTALV